MSAMQQTIIIIINMWIGIWNGHGLIGFRHKNEDHNGLDYNKYFKVRRSLSLRSQQ